MARDESAKPESVGGAGQGFRMSATGVIREQIKRLRTEADGLENLLRYLEAYELPPEIDEVLWRVLNRPSRW
jgi:hypothetical protein